MHLCVAEGGELSQAQQFVPKLMPSKLGPPVGHTVPLVDSLLPVLQW